ncbi:UNVERIFIED_CONTAM: hypothetical protein NCL1_19903 [Trichonephila clavipes]
MQTHISLFDMLARHIADDPFSLRSGANIFRARVATLKEWWSHFYFCLRKRILPQEVVVRSKKDAKAWNTNTALRLKGSKNFFQ